MTAKTAEPLLPSLTNIINNNNIQNILEIIDQKLMRENIKIDISDPEDQNIGRVFAEIRHKGCLAKLIASMSGKQRD